MICGKYCFEDNITNEVEVSSLADDVSKDQNETEDEADDIAKHKDDNPKLVRKGIVKIDWTMQ